MNKIVEFLNANPVQYLATVGRDSKAKCRPFMFSDELEGKLWFCTNNQEDVYKDMQKNPEIEISFSSPEYAWIRLQWQGRVREQHGCHERQDFDFPAGKNQEHRQRKAGRDFREDSLHASHLSRRYPRRVGGFLSVRS